MGPPPALPAATRPQHHLGLAGRTDQLFSDDAVTLIHQTGRGLPRAINNLGLQALVAIGNTSPGPAFRS